MWFSASCYSIRDCYKVYGVSPHSTIKFILSEKDKLVQKNKLNVCK